MPIKRIPIRSVDDPNNPKPWFEMDLDEASMSLRIRKANGLSRALAGVSPRAEQALVKTHPLQLNPQARDEIHALAVTLDGSLEFVPMSKQRPVYYAHLGFYDPRTDTWELLEFVPE